jgi:colicin import membrane protein
MPATAAMRPRRPEQARNDVPSFLAALAMHALLVAGLWVAVQWRTSSEAPAVAELWAPLPPLETTPVVQPPAPVQPPPPPPAPPQPEMAKPEADIVLKQRVKPHAPDQESPPPEERRPIEKREPKKNEKSEAKAAAERAERERRLADQMRQSEIERLTGEASGAAATTPGAARTPFASTGVISNAYSALVKACIRPHIVFAVPEGTPDSVYAEFKVDLLPTGEHAAPPQLTKPSGLPGYDDAAERAIIRCDPFPRNSDGTVPRTFTLKMYPTEAR